GAARICNSRKFAAYSFRTMSESQFESSSIVGEPAVESRPASERAMCSNSEIGTAWGQIRPRCSMAALARGLLVDMLPPFGYLNCSAAVERTSGLGDDGCASEAANKCMTRWGSGVRWMFAAERHNKLWRKLRSFRKSRYCSWAKCSFWVNWRS